MPPSSRSRTASARSRTKPAEARRDDLMDAAQQLFLAHGVAATTIDQITSRAGVAKGTFYLYFASKHDVVAALGERVAQELRERVDAAVAACPADDWAARLGAWAEAMVDGYLGTIDVHDVAFHSGAASARGAVVDNVVIDHLAALLQAGDDAGAWSVDDAASGAAFLFSGLHGLVDHAHVQPNAVSRNRLRARARRLVLGALGRIAP